MDGICLAFCKTVQPPTHCLDRALTPVTIFEISSLAYKPYPSGVVIHPIIDACLDIVKTKSFDATQIEHIELTLNPLAAKLTNLVDPKDRGQALVSLQHWAAAALVYKAAGIAQVSNDIVRNPAISALRRKVTFKNDDRVGREAARLRVVLTDGKTLEADVQHCRGSVERPLNDEDITDKTRGQLQTVYPHGTAAQILAQCWRIEELPRVDAFCKALAHSE